VLERRSDRLELGNNARCHQIMKRACDRCADNERDDRVLRGYNRQDDGEQASPARLWRARNANDGGIVVFRNTHSNFRLDRVTAAPGLMFGPELVEARLELPIDAFAVAQLARPLQGNDIARLGHRREHQAGSVAVAPDEAGHA